MARDRVEEPDRVRLAGKIGFPRGLDEGEVDRLEVVAGREPVAQGMQRAALLGRRDHLRGRARRNRGNALEAVDARNLLDQVLLDAEVEPVGRGRDRVFAIVLSVLKIESTKNRINFLQ